MLVQMMGPENIAQTTILLGTQRNDRFIQDFMNTHIMFVDVYVRAVIDCLLPLFHGFCML